MESYDEIDEQVGNFFEVGQRVQGIGGGWEHYKGTVIFYFGQNLEVRLDETGDEISTSPNNFKKIPGRGWVWLLCRTHASRSLYWDQVGLNDISLELAAVGYTDKEHIRDLLSKGYVLRSDKAQYRVDFHDFTSNALTVSEKRFWWLIESDLTDKVKHSKLSIERVAERFNITDKTIIKELTELAIVSRARQLAHEGATEKERFDSIVELYQTQVNLSHRTSQSILLQQYSTPVPIGYLSGIFCGIDTFVKDSKKLLEPSAGNGALTIAADPDVCHVNDVDHTRYKNLHAQGFEAVLRSDASREWSNFYKRFDAVLTNPPFGAVDKPRIFDSFPMKNLDHIMVCAALEALKPDGRAAMIVGGHRKWDSKGRVQAGEKRIFYNYLYNHFNVIDVIMIDGRKLYSRQGTAFPTELILIAGKKSKAEGAAPVFGAQTDKPVRTFEELYQRVSHAKQIAGEFATLSPVERNKLIKRALELGKKFSEDEDLGAPYKPASENPFNLDTQVPDSMSFEIHSALDRIRQEVGGDIDNFVRHRLGYKSKAALSKALAAEQIDAVALAIYNIESKGQGMIIGDQTGIGKGRVAASVIRYGVLQGLKPVFVTEKANLFSDIYRDLAAIGSGHLVPFIVNGREPKTDIKDEDGNVVYQALPPTEQEAIFKEGSLPPKFDFIAATYSQFNSPEKKPVKPGFLLAVSLGNIMILDESHNSSGSSNTGEYMQKVVSQAKGVVYLSATFAKRPDNMPIYAMKTAIRDANMSRFDLIEAIRNGGVALQEIISSQMVAEGQMIRRERSYEGIEVNYIALDEYKTEHEAIADSITQVLRDIIDFQSTYIDKAVDELDTIAVAEGKEVEVREGTSQAGVDNLPYFSKVFNVINQMLFSIKAEAVADRAIARLKEGKKPVIAFASTMGSFIEQMENEHGMSIGDGDVIKADFSLVLRKGLDGVLRYTVKDIDGTPTFETFHINELPPEGQAAYYSISERIDSISTGISISPIDVVIQKIQAAGYSVAEVTGRKFQVQLNSTGQGLVKSRKKVNTNDAFRLFNNNQVDVLMINQSGSTGASAHALPTAKVAKDEVRQRVMLVLQAELDINTEVQKRGRINRTGQTLKPIYDYMISAIPAEKRLMMMLQKKLKSLDANTTSNQRQSTSILDVPDFLNKYGDKVIKEYLQENEEVNKLLGDPLNFEKKSKVEVIEDAAHKVSGRVAVLPVKAQQEFYDDITERYNDYVEYLKQVDEYDLEVETMDLKAEVISTEVIKMGKGGENAFGEDSILETIKANVLKKPFTAKELHYLISESLGGRSYQEVSESIRDNFKQFQQARLIQETAKVEMKYNLLIKSVPSDKKIEKIRDKQGEDAWHTAIQKKTQELIHAKADQLATLEKQSENATYYLERILKFFYIGRSVNYPAEQFNGGHELTPAICIGVMIDERKKNPYAPNAVKIRLAIASSLKYITIPASYYSQVNSIIGVSMDLDQPRLDDLLIDWTQAVSKRSADRTTRHIITGNLLQAANDYKGKLVSYTTLEGETKKGILMPEYWTTSDGDQQGIVAPIYNARKIVASTIEGKSVATNNGMVLIKHSGGFKVLVSASRERAGHYYLDEDLLPLVDKNIFEKVSDQMVALLPDINLNAFLEVLQHKHNVSITIQKEFAYLLDKSRASRNSKPISLPPPEEPESDSQSTIPPAKVLRLRAKALALALKLNLAA